MGVLSTYRNNSSGVYFFSWFFWTTNVCLDIESTDWPSWLWHLSIRAIYGKKGTTMSPRSVINVNRVHLSAVFNEYNSLNECTVAYPVFIVFTPEFGVRFPVSAVWKKQKCFFPIHVWKSVLCSASDRQGSNFESCIWSTVSSQSSHHPQEVLLAQFSLYVHEVGLNPDSFHFICIH